MTTISNSPAAWYIPGEAKQPTGPFTAEQIIQALQTGRMTTTPFPPPPPIFAPEPPCSPCYDPP
jgi:hypothetical protein